MAWIKVDYDEIHNFEWDKVKPFALCEVFKTGDGKVAQVYPYNLLKAVGTGESTGELVEYNRRCDGKRYFSTGIRENGFTPKNIVGACRGWSKRYFDDVVEAILDCGN